MRELLTNRSREVLTNAQVIARMCGHESVDAPHVLLAILHRPDTKGCAALNNAGLHYRDVLPAVQAMPKPATRTPAHTDTALALTAQADALLRQALHEAHSDRQQFVETAHLALACARPDSAASLKPLLTGREAAIRHAARDALRQAARLQAQMREQDRALNEARSVRQQRLDRMNDVRMRRAQLKRDLALREASIQQILLAPPDCALTAQVLDLLLAVPGYHRRKASRLLAQCRIQATGTIGELSHRQRADLIKLL